MSVKYTLKDVYDYYWVDSPRDPKQALFSSLTEAIIKNDYEHGGKLGLVTGEQGCGKTTFLLNYLEEQFKAKSICIWRGRDLDHICRIDYFPERCIFYIPQDEKENFRFYLINHYEKKVEDITKKLNIKTYSSLNDFKNLKNSYIHVIYEPVKTAPEQIVDDAVINRLKLQSFRSELLEDSRVIWYFIIHSLLQKTSDEFHTLLIDEVDDLFPSLAQGYIWRLVAWFKDLIKDFRKAYINFLGTTHNLFDIDFRVLGKLNYFVLMKGADKGVLKKKGVKMKLVRTEFLQKGEFFLIVSGIIVQGRTRPYKSKDVLLRKYLEEGENEPERDSAHSILLSAPLNEGE